MICDPLRNQRTVEISRKLKHFDNLFLAAFTNDDKNLIANSKDFNVLIGNYFSFITGEIKRGNNGEPLAINTHCGWIVCGKIPSDEHDNTITIHTQVQIHVLRADTIKFPLLQKEQNEKLPPHGNMAKDTSLNYLSKNIIIVYRIIIC